MFGYIKPLVPELKVKEHELYKASYCGLCKTMGKCTGCISKFTLNYDFVFLALIRMVLEKRTGNVSLKRCIAHPFKRRPMLDMNPTLEFSAKSSIILTEMKLKDNINDSHGLKRLKARTVNLITLFFRKMPNDFLPLKESVANNINALSELERKNVSSIDEVACVFGNLLSEVASFGLCGEEAEVAKNIGFHLGKWIYVIDACDDIKSDLKTKSFNVIVNSYGENISKGNAELIRCSCGLEINDINQYLDKIDFSSHRDVEGIIRNVLSNGLFAVTQKVLEEYIK